MQHPCTDLISEKSSSIPFLLISWPSQNELIYNPLTHSLSASYELYFAVTGRADRPGQAKADVRL